jgi:hypothetical protein
MNGELVSLRENKEIVLKELFLNVFVVVYKL